MFCSFGISIFGFFSWWFFYFHVFLCVCVLLIYPRIDNYRSSIFPYKFKDFLILLFLYLGRFPNDLRSLLISVIFNRLIYFILKQAISLRASFHILYRALWTAFPLFISSYRGRVIFFYSHKLSLFLYFFLPGTWLLRNYLNYSRKGQKN